MAPGGDDEGVVALGRARPGSAREAVVGHETAPPSPSASASCAALDGHPARAGTGELDGHRPPGAGERAPSTRSHSGRGGHEHERAEQVVQLLGVAQLGPGLLDDRRHHRRVERGEVVRLERQAAPRRDRPRAALLEGRVVEEGVGAPVQDLLGQHRGDHRVDAVGPHLARADLARAPRSGPRGPSPRCSSRRASGARSGGRGSRSARRRSPGRRRAPGRSPPSGRRPPCAGWRAGRGGCPGSAGRRASGTGSSASAR